MTADTGTPRRGRLLSRAWLSCAAAVLAAALATTACSPCDGVSTCTTSPRVAVQGKLVDGLTGNPASGAQVALVRTGGASRDSASTTTDAQGNYQLEVDGPSGTFDAVVSPAGLPSYRVRNLTLTSTTTHGGGQVLGVWVAAPLFDTAIQLYLRADPTQVPATSFVFFHRTGGVAISLIGDYSVLTDDAGRGTLLANVTAAGLDDVVGTLSISLPNDLGTSVFPNFHITPDYQYHPSTIHRIGVGPQLSWIASIYNRATVARVPGTTVTFVRTGGIQTRPTSFTAVTNQSGEFVFPLVPATAGTVIGTLTIQPPAPFHSYSITGLAIPTFDADQNPFLASYGVGPHLPWLGTLYCQGKPVVGATVYAVRVGGIAADPASMYSTSDSSGNFSLIFKPHDYGTLLVDLDMEPPPSSPCYGLTWHNLELPTLDFDSDARFIKAWPLTPK